MTGLPFTSIGVYKERRLPVEKYIVLLRGINVGETRPEYESVDHHGMVIFWSAPVKTFQEPGGRRL